MNSRKSLVSSRRSFPWSLVILGLLALVFACGATGGCGGAITRTYYHNPSWLPNGKIICTKYVNVSTQPDMIGASKDISNAYYLTTMNDDGTGEENIKEIDSFASGGEIAASPDGRYIAVAATTSIRVFNSDFSDYSIITPEGNSLIEHLDFSPTSEGYKIVYTNYNNELRLTDINASFNNLLTTSAEGVAWRVGEKIVFEGLVDGLYTYLFIINNTGDSKTKLDVSGLYPQNMSSQFVIYRGTETSIEKFSLLTSSETTVIDDYSQTTLKLSFGESKIAGGVLNSGSINNIYVTDISTGATTQLR